LRQSVYGRLAGYEDLRRAERLSQDPTFRLIGSEKIFRLRTRDRGERGAALTSRLQSFETEMLTEEQNFAGLAPSWPTGVARDGINETNGSDGGGWEYNRLWPVGQNGNPG
jgi:hypothetical protein